MDSAPSDSLPKLDTSSNTSAVPPTTGAVGATNAGYYQPPSGPSRIESSGGVPPAPGSPTLGSTTPASPSAPPVGAPPIVAFESPTRSAVPAMGMNPVTAPAAVPPTVSNEATANQVQERMQTANAAAGSKAGKKRSLLLPILGVIVVLAMAAAGAFWWWNQQQMNASLQDMDRTLTQTEMQEDLESTEPEGVVARDESLALLPTNEQVTEASADTAEVYGLICKYGEEHPAGTVLFYEPESETVHRLAMAQDKNIYSMTVPAGQYMAFFEPADSTLPIFAFTQYVNCGLDPNSCTDHSMAIFTVEAGQEYGQIDICDPQYVQDGLPTELQYENS